MKLTADMDKLIEDKNYKQLDVVVSEALESYPLQPYLYYIKGIALVELNDLNNAAFYLQSGLRLYH